MGLVSSVISRLFVKKRMQILMVGLDNAGKTTILYRLKSGEIVPTVPTIGYNYTIIEYKNINCFMIDLGGQDTIRPLWHRFFPGTQGLIFVVDSHDQDRIAEAADELQCLLHENELRDAVLLVYATKQDLENSMNVEEIARKLGLNYQRSRPWHIQGINATHEDGLYEGLEWLTRELENM